MDRATQSDAQLDVFRAMTPEQRLRAAVRLYWSARAFKAAALRSMHPDLSEREIEAKVRQAFLYARD